MLNFKFNIVKAFFLEGLVRLYDYRQGKKNFEAALERIVEIRKISDSIRPDLHFEALLYQIIVYLEQKEYHFTREKLIPDASWFLRKIQKNKTKDASLEENLLKLFSKYATIEDRKRADALQQIVDLLAGSGKYPDIQSWSNRRSRRRLPGR